VLVCWGVWYLSPAHVEWLVFNREAVFHGEWWRLWTMHLTHESRARLIEDSAVICFFGLVLRSYSRFFQLLAGLLLAMPMVGWLLLTLMPDVSAYHGAAGVAAMLWMMSGWFLIVQSRSLSIGFWVGYLILSILMIKVFIEAVAIWTPFVVAAEGLELAWMVQLFGVLLGLAMFNAYNRLYAGRNSRKSRPSMTPDGKPVPLPLNAPRPDSGVHSRASQSGGGK